MANALSKQIYQEVRTIAMLISGINPRARKLAKFKLSQLLKNERLIVEDRFRSFDEMARVYHLITELLSEIYDIMRENAH